MECKASLEALFYRAMRSGRVKCEDGLGCRRSKHFVQPTVSIQTALGPEQSVGAQPQSRRSTMNDSMAWPRPMRKAIVLVRIRSRTKSSNRVARNRGGAAGFMAEFSNAFFMQLACH